jgi:hypothetical protein
VIVDEVGLFDIGGGRCGGLVRLVTGQYVAHEVVFCAVATDPSEVVLGIRKSRGKKPLLSLKCLVASYTSLNLRRWWFYKCQNITCRKWITSFFLTRLSCRIIRVA